MNKRIVYIALTLILLAVEVLIALFVHDSFVRPYIGDVLVVIVLYTFVRIILPEGVKLLPVYIFIFSVVVEVLQFFDVVRLLGLSDSRFFSVLIGGTFDLKDIVCYGVGCVILMVTANIGNIFVK